MKTDTVYTFQKTETSVPFGIFIPDGHKAQYARTCASVLITKYIDQEWVKELLASGLDRHFFNLIQATHDGAQNWNGLNFIGKGIFTRILEKYDIDTSFISNSSK